MTLEINTVAGLVAGIAAMVPGSVIYAPQVLGTRWAKEIGRKIEDMGGNPAKSLTMMLVTSLINGLVASTIVKSIGAHGVGEAVEVSLLLSWFMLSASLAIVFFEERSWTWFGITFLNYVTTFAVIGVVLGLFIK